VALASAAFTSSRCVFVHQTTRVQAVILIGELVRHFLGYDLFISYSRHDARNYAANLAARLQSEDLVCFLDREALLAGDVLNSSLERGIRRSSVLLLIASPGAIASPHVGLELSLAENLAKSVLSIDVGGLAAQLRRPSVRDAIWINEAPEVFAQGRPSDDAVTEIRKRFQSRRRNRVMRLILMSVILGLAALASWALVERSIARDREAEAERQRREAQRNLAQAFLEKGDRAWAGREVGAAELFYAKSLTLRDDSLTRAKLLEVRAVGTALRWVSPTRPESSTITVEDSALVVALSSGPISIYDARSGRLVQELRGHAGGASATALVGGRLLSGGATDLTVKLWDLTTGDLIAMHDRHTQKVLAVGRSAHDGTFLSVGADSTIVRWRPGADGFATRVEMPEAILNVAAVCPGRDTVVLGSESGAVSVWSVQTNQVVSRLPAFAAPVRGVTCSRHGTRFAAVDAEGNLAIASVPDASALVRFKVDKGSGLFLSGLDFSSDDERLAIGAAGKIELWNVPQSKRQARFGTGRAPVILPAFNKTEELIFSAGSSVQAWDPLAGSELALFSGHGAAVYGVAFRPPDGSVAASGGFDKTLRYWNVATGDQIRTVATEGESVLSVSFLPDGKSLCTAEWSGLILCRDAESDRVTFAQRHPTISPRMAVNPASPDVAASGGGSLAVWNTATGHRRFVIAADDAFAYSSDGTRVASALGQTLRIVGALTGTIDRTIELPFTIGQLAWSPNGRRLLASEKEGQTRRNPRLKLQPIDVASGALGALLEETPYEVMTLRFCPSSQCFLTAGLSVAELWDARTGERISALDPKLPGRKYIPAAAFSGNGRELLLGTERGSIELWDLDRRREAATLRGDAEQALRLASSSDGRWIAVVKLSGAIELWTPGAAVPTRTLAAPDRKLKSAAFDPSSERLAAGDDSGRVFIWRLATLPEPAIHKVGTSRVDLLTWLDPHKLIVACAAPEKGLQSEPDVLALWDVDTGRGQRLTHSMLGALMAMATSPGDSAVAFGGAQQRIDVMRGSPLANSRPLEGHRGTITGLAFAGPLLLSSSRDGTVKGWNLDETRTAFTLGGFRHWVEGVAALSPTRAVAVGSYGELRFFSLNDAADSWQMNLFDSKLIENLSWVKSLGFDRASQRLAVSSGESMHVKVLDLEQVERTRSASPAELFAESSALTGLRIDGTEAVARRLSPAQP
jgi:WD40 repeat protein